MSRGGPSHHGGGTGEGARRGPINGGVVDGETTPEQPRMRTTVEQMAVDYQRRTRVRCTFRKAHWPRFGRPLASDSLVTCDEVHSSAREAVKERFFMDIDDVHVTFDVPRSHRLLLRLGRKKSSWYNWNSYLERWDRNWR